MNSLPLKLLLAIVLGGLIGLERESASESTSETGSNTKHGDPWGLRTYSLISLLGAVAGLLSLFGNLYLSIIITVSFFIFMFLYYGIGGWMIKSMGLTTELGAVFSYLIGYFVTSNILPIHLVIAISVVIELILSVKSKSRSIILGITRSEVNAFIGLSIIALAVLPFLPNRPFHLTDVAVIRNLLQGYNADLSFYEKIEILNPFRLWLMVVLITAIDVIGYLLARLIGNKKSIILTSAIGGFVSSTLTTQSLAIKSRNASNINELVAAAIFANMVSFIHILILVAPLNTICLVKITPIIAVLTITALTLGILFHLREKQKIMASQDTENTNQSETGTAPKIFALRHALIFALILVIIQTITKTALVLFGNTGFLITSIAASIAGLDALIINLAEIAGRTITIEAALFTLLCVNATNIIGKMIFSMFQGKREFTVKFISAMSFVILTSFAAYYFLIV